MRRWAVAAFSPCPWCGGGDEGTRKPRSPSSKRGVVSAVVLTCNGGGRGRADGDSESCGDRLAEGRRCGDGHVPTYLWFQRSSQPES
uniref:Uncharacterized protein n=1 Tax=Leersia perrieri TaxID=77586 RepID=A0A0D9W2M1_9ORYZ